MRRPHTPAGPRNGPGAAATDETGRDVRRELTILLVLTIVTVGAFLLTRTIARWDQAWHRRDAAAAFLRGAEAMHEGRAVRAVESFRAAVAGDRDDTRYALALADALAATNLDNEAQQVLRRWRAASPERGDVNVRLARLAARRGDTDRAVEYYHHAIYGVWPRSFDGVRDLRVELIRLLIQQRANSAAQAELLALAANLPQNADWHLKAARLFGLAGDPRRAFDHYTRALAFDTRSVEAAAGAGASALAVGDYAAARRAFTTAVALGAAPEIRERLNVVRLVFSADPLSPRLSLTGRRDRLRAALERGIARLERCPDQPPQPPGSGRSLLLSQARTMARTTNIRALARDPDFLHAGLTLVVRMEDAAAGCGPETALDEALRLIARRHTEAEP